jgi:hypothetical protein
MLAHGIADAANQSPAPIRWVGENPRPDRQCADHAKHRPSRRLAGEFDTYLHFLGAGETLAALGQGIRGLRIIVVAPVFSTRSLCGLRSWLRTSEARTRRVAQASLRARITVDVTGRLIRPHRFSLL